MTFRGIPVKAGPVSLVQSLCDRNFPCTVSKDRVRISCSQDISHRHFKGNPDWSLILELGSYFLSHEYASKLKSIELNTDQYIPEDITNKQTRPLSHHKSQALGMHYVCLFGFGTIASSILTVNGESTFSCQQSQVRVPVPGQKKGTNPVRGGESFYSCLYPQVCTHRCSCCNLGLR